MAKQEKSSTAKAPAAQDRKARRAAAREGRDTVRKPEKKRPYTLEDCMRLGLIGNILFVVFIVICLIYYYSLASKGNFVIPFEIVAYTVELGGFAFFTTSVVWLDRLVRARGIMKVLLIVYIVIEVLLMLLEFQLVPFIPYNGLSLWLTIAHVLFSTGVSFSLLLLDPKNTKLQWIVGITSVIILGGMFFGAAGYRVYASILVNAFAYIVFFAAMRRQVILEEMDIDCYGDAAKQTEFSSTLFADTPTMVETPKPEKKPSLAKKAKLAAEDLWKGNEEHEVLTDKDEKFEYEFGVIEDDDDDEYEDDEYEDDGVDEEDREDT